MGPTIYIFCIENNMGTAAYCHLGYCIHTHHITCSSSVSFLEGRPHEYPRSFVCSRLLLFLLPFNHFILSILVSTTYLTVPASFLTRLIVLIWMLTKGLFAVMNYCGPVDLGIMSQKSRPTMHRSLRRESLYALHY